MNESLKCDRNTLLKRLYFQSHHRGCKETDLVLGRFADNALAGLDEAGLAAYEAFLQENDADIWAWLSGKSSPERADYAPILEALRHFPEGLSPQ